MPSPASPGTAGAAGAGTLPMLSPNQGRATGKRCKEAPSQGMLREGAHCAAVSYIAKEKRSDGTAALMFSN